MESSWIESGIWYYSPSLRLYNKETAEEVRLSGRERDHLTLLLEKAGSPVSREQLWQHDEVRGSLPNKRKLHDSMHILRNKMADASDGRGVFIVVDEGYGYRWTEPVVKHNEPFPIDERRKVNKIARAKPVVAKLRTDCAGNPPRFPQPRVAATAGAALMGSLMGVTVATEVSNEFDRFRGVAMKGAPLVAIGSGLATAAGLAATWRQTSQRKRAGFLAGLGAVAGGIAGAAFLVSRRLPTEPIVHLQGIQAFPARTGLFKSAIGYPMLAAVPFMYVPAHTVAALERDVRDGRCQQVLDLLQGHEGAVVPEGALFVRPRYLWMLLALCVAGAVPMGLLLLNAVRPGPRAALFSSLVLLRFSLWLLTAAAGVRWYQTRIDDLERSLVEPTAPGKAA